MSRIGFAYRATRPLAIVALVVAVALPLNARAESPALVCDAPLNLIRFAHPLARVSQKLSNGDPITIVAMGSSSTAGTGASSPVTTYPSRLEAELTQQFPGHLITVLNRGVGGEEVADMLKRFDTAVIAAKPDLVLWQLGTNSVIHDYKINDQDTLIRAGLAKIRSMGADVVLIDPQFAPMVIVKPEAAHMVELIATAAKNEDVDLFPRFDLMKRWYDVDRMKFESFVSPDGLHMNDWSYGCLAKALSVAISEAAQRPVLSVTVMRHLVQ